MAKERGLGRGLDALFGDTSLQTQGDGPLSLPISQVEPRPGQPRTRFDQESLADLADSIRIHGIIQPLTVRRLSSGYYQIIAGERRWRAAKLAGLSEVPAVVIEADNKKAAELAMIENLQREDLNPMEEARGYQSLIEEYGLTQDEVAQRMGKSRPAVTNALRLTTLPDTVCQLLEEGRLSAGHGRAILSAEGKSAQRQLAQRVIEEGLSVRQTEALAKKMNREAELARDGVPAKPDDPYKMYRDAAAKELSDRFGRRVAIVHGAKKGKVELEYYNDDDLNDLLDLLEQIKAQPKGGAAL
ncbi:MAG: ParB/RepB/Spo0J family partition protein [Clostridiales bacterium]|nr:ParB/RepB/Spo0J family partition protein [Clostridiales bacterium]